MQIRAIGADSRGSRLVCIGIFYGVVAEHNRYFAAAAIAGIVTIAIMSPLLIQEFRQQKSARSTDS